MSITPDFDAIKKDQKGFKKAVQELNDEMERYDKEVFIPRIKRLLASIPIFILGIFAIMAISLNCVMLMFLYVGLISSIGVYISGIWEIKKEKNNV